MPGWICPVCKSENNLFDSQCRICGQPRADIRDRGASRAAISSTIDEMRSRNQRVLDELRGSLSRSPGDILSSQRSASPSSSPQATPAPLGTYGLENAELFEEDEEELADLVSYAEIGRRLQMTETGPALNLLMRQVGAPPFQRISNRDLKLKVKASPRLNYSLVHSGLPLIKSLQIHNNSKEALQNILVKAWVAPDYSEPWQKTLPDILPGKKHVEEKICLPLVQSRLRRVNEAEEGCLRVDVLADGELYFSDTYPMQVLAYNEWYYSPGLEDLMACFVRPNSEAVERIISLVRDRLRRENKTTDISGYQRNNPEKVIEMMEALYYTLQQDLKITYINPPASFEGSETLWGTFHSVSQKVFFAEQIFEHRRGTCLDLALLCAACVERMGLQPMSILMKGHAYYGLWITFQHYIRNALLHLTAVWKKHAQVMKLVEKNEFMPLNSTTFAVGSDQPFQTCREEGMHFLLDSKVFWCGVDVSVAHKGSAKPLP